MATYTAHELEDVSGTLTERADAVTFVKEGFAWLALFFPVFWLLYNRMWIVLAGFVGALIAMEFGLSFAGVEEDVAAWAATGLVLMFAFQANDLRRWTLVRQGYRLARPVTGANLTACELNFFDTWLAAQDGPRIAPAEQQDHESNVPADAKQQQNIRGSDSGDDVIGLFPDANA